MPYAHIAANVADVRERIARSCERANRHPAAVTLIAVTKTHPPAAIIAAYEAGVRDFGENRVQEARAKRPAVRDHCPGATWHLIGHLQRNKVPAAVDLFDVIHSVDSERLAHAIGERAMDSVRVYLEVNISGEPTKQGVAPGGASGVAHAIAGLPNIALVGLMTVAPISAGPETVRPIFRHLRDLRDALGLAELSMGMTDDFEIAIEEGATAVRVGRAIFGPRA
jgi:hypothetical protein